MVRHLRPLLRLVAATAIAILGLAVAFVVAPAQDSSGTITIEQELAGTD